MLAVPMMVRMCFLVYVSIFWCFNKMLLDNNTEMVQ